MLVAGCSDATVINTGEPPPQTATAAPSAAPSTPPSNAHLVNAFDYVGHVGDHGLLLLHTEREVAVRDSGAHQGGLSGVEQLAVRLRRGLGVEGEPDSTNAIVVDRDGDPRFVALEQPEFWLDPGPAKALQFNRILAAAGFRCNVQESGVSCQSESSGKGFTFSADGFTRQYTDVPAGAP
jgi:hypothetical protein